MGPNCAAPTLNLIIALQSSLTTEVQGVSEVWVLGLYQSEAMTFPFTC